MASFFYTDDTLRVIGAAVGIVTQMEQDSLLVTDHDLNHWSETLCLIQPLPNNQMNELRCAQFNILDTSRIMRVIGRSTISMDDMMTGETVRDIPIYEVMFTDTIPVIDSFCISYSNYYGEYKTNYPGYLVLWDDYTGNCMDKPLRTAEYLFNGPWDIFYSKIILWLWPIIDTTGMIFPCDTFYCPKVTDNHLLYPANIAYGYAEFGWTGDAQHDRWQLSYCEPGVVPDSGRLIPCNTPSATVYNLRDSVHYVAYVRGHCSECDNWGEWSDGVEFWKEMNNHSGIHPSPLERYTHIAPNPAHDAATVFSSFGLRSVCLFDGEGRMRLEQPLSGYQATLDLRGLPAGTYIASITTPRGTIAQKLVVE